ncbi:MAG: hypothetical protein ACP5OA_02965 [Candidatus Woesearchaeota archaeon]
MDETEKEKLVISLLDLKKNLEKLSIAEIHVKIIKINKSLETYNIKSALFIPKNETFFPQLRDSINFMIKRL